MAKTERLVILRRVNGQLELDHKNFNDFFEIVKLNQDTPLAILSFIGEKGSGKTFYTNLLIQNLRNNGTGDWLSHVSQSHNHGSHCQPLPGFPYDEDKTDVSETTTSEVSLWAEAFWMKNHGKKFVVLVLHVNFNGADKKQDTVDSMELFLALMSSRIVEIQWKREEFKLLEIYHRLLEKDINLFKSFLTNHALVYLLRTNRKPPKGPIITESEALTHLKKLIKASKTSKFDMEYLVNVNIAHVSDGKETLLNSHGVLMLPTEIYNNLKTVVNLIADDEEIFPKIIFDTGEMLTVGRLKEFLSSCMKLANDVTKKTNEYSTIEVADVASKLLLGEADSKIEIIVADNDGNSAIHVAQCGGGTKENTAEYSTTSPKIPSEPSIEGSKANENREESTPNHKTNESLHNFSIAEKPNEVKASTDAQYPATIGLNLEDLSDFVMKQVKDKILCQLKNGKLDDGDQKPTVLPDFPKILEEKLTIYLNNVFEKASGMTEENRKWVTTSCSNRSSYLRQELINIQNLLQSFFETITTMNTNKGYILPEEFPKLLNNMEKTAKASLMQVESFDYTMRVCKWLVSKYIDENQSFFAALEVICFEEVQTFYAEEGKLFLKNGPYDTKTLSKIHSLVLSQCVTAVVTAIEPSIDPERLKAFGEHKFSKQYSVLKQSNRKMMQIMVKRVNNLIAKAKERYDQNEKLNNILNTTKLKGTKSALCKKAHEQARAEAVKFLEERIIMGDIRDEEPVDGHQKLCLQLLTVIGKS